MKEFLKKKWVKRSIVIIIVLVILAMLLNGGNTKTTYRTDVVEKGDIEVSISGSGTIVASEARTETSKVSSKVTEVFYKEGDTVKAGDVIAKLDSKDYAVSVESQRLSVRQLELSKKNTDRQVSNLKIVAPTSGYVSNLNLKEGAFVSSNMQVCNILNESKYEVKLQVMAGAEKQIAVGNLAQILLVDTMNYISGTVTFVGEQKHVTTGGVQTIDVTILANNAQYALDGIVAKADITTASGNVISTMNQASFTAFNNSMVKTEVMGTVKTVYAKEGQYVTAGEAIAQLENSDLTLSAQTSSINLQNAYNQLKYAEDKLEDYTVVAEIDGTITKLDLKVGSQVTPGTVLATVSNENEMEFQIPVDELDIAKINYDSEVFVTIDAIPETEINPIKGKITKMPLQGVTVGGVTDYYITITIEGVTDVRISMNANAKIIVQTAKDVVYIPLEALNKKDGRTYVEVKTGETVEERDVVTGISDVSNIEIKEGLTIGEEVVVPDLGNGFGMLMGG